VSFASIPSTVDNSSAREAVLVLKDGANPAILGFIIGVIAATVAIFIFD
jgi:hypothetical protein